ncbi:MAG TPA: tetratricopeptide repeat protein, partial [Ilumatobacteraceae bacterium]|nr:tetratricopeptide repeat protein [Ilumatobacteraceae bacterium]
MSIRCLQPGCSGAIEDGYCNECGLAPVGGRHASAHVSANDPGTELLAPSPRTDAPSVAASSETPRSVTTGSAPSRQLVALPAAHVVSALDALISNPEVAEDRRFCSRCDAAVGRSDGERPGRLEGFCPSCGQRYSFMPKLSPGDVVGGQYEVAGCLAHGGLGWVYLAKDRHLDDKLVVLKGLLDTGDEHAAAAAIAERQFLVEVEHPDIVRVHNFVEHAGDSYLVMEYVTGSSVRALLEARRRANGGTDDPLAPAQALALTAAILPAIGHLHDIGLAYCDFKPDNLMRTKSGVKLIDLGGAYRMVDHRGPVYGTPGFQAPEVPRTGPTVESDIHTVGRTLAVMFGERYGDAGPASDSLSRLVARATAADPTRRFRSASSMVCQVEGVLRQTIVTGGDAVPPTPSDLFTGERPGAVDRPDWHVLPVPLVDTADPAARFLAALGAIDSEHLLQQLANAPEQTIEVRLRSVRALLRAARFDEARSELSAIASKVPNDWRVAWYRGVAAFADGALTDAQLMFETLRDELPGESAVLLADAMARELGGRDGAGDRYQLVSLVDPSFTAASFGLARCQLASNDVDGAVAALGRVLDSSPAHVAAQRGAIRLTLGLDAPRHRITADDVAACERAVIALRCNESERLELEVDVMTVAMEIAIGVA